MLKDKDTPLPLLRERMKIGKFLFDELDKKTENDFDLIAYCNEIIKVLPWDKRPNKDMVFDIASEFVAIYKWRKHKCIYAFDPDLAQELKRQAEDMSDLDTLPAEILLHLPYPCLYVHCPCLIDESVVGFFAFIEKNDCDLSSFCKCAATPKIILRFASFSSSRRNENRFIPYATRSCLPSQTPTKPA